jgi:hypothetical protein
MRFLARDPRFRPQSAAELARELATSIGHPTATHPTERIRSSPPSRSTRVGVKRLWPLLASAIVVAAAAAVAATVRLTGETEAPAPPRPHPVVPPARGATPKEEAQNLSAWLRKHSG